MLKKLNTLISDLRNIKYILALIVIILWALGIIQLPDHVVQTIIEETIYAPF